MIPWGASPPPFILISKINHIKIKSFSDASRAVYQKNPLEKKEIIYLAPYNALRAIIA